MLGFVIVFFFFQAEDGIRDYKVTGVQTCALPIFPRSVCQSNVPSPVTTTSASATRRDSPSSSSTRSAPGRAVRSEERRVGKEGRSRWRRADWIKKEYGE